MGKEHANRLSQRANGSSPDSMPEGTTPRRSTVPMISRDLGFDPDARSRFARASPPSRAASSPTCTAAASGPCASTPASARPTNPTRATTTCSSKGRPGFRSPSICRRRWGCDSDHPAGARAKSGSVGVAIDSLDDMQPLFARHPARQSLHVDDHQRHGGHPAGALHRRGRGAGRRPARSSARHHPERHPQGIHRARHVHLSRRGPRCASSPTSSRSRAAKCRDWNTISISGYHMREAGCDAVQELAFTLANGIAYVDAAVQRGPRRRQLRAAALVLLQRAQQLSRRDRQVPRGAPASGRASCASASARKTPRSCMLRFHCQTAGMTLTAQQPLNNVVRVALQALAAVCGGTQSLHTNSSTRPSAFPPRSGHHRPAHAADRRARERRGRHRRSVGRQLRDRSTHPPHRSTGRAPTSRASTRWAAWSAPSSRATSSARSSPRRTPTSSTSRSKRRIIVGVNEFVSESPKVHVLKIDPAHRSRAGRPRAQAEAPRATRAAHARALETLEGAARHRTTWCRSSSTRFARWRRWARSATCCAKSSASTSPAHRSEA